jgi:hypothetical protein
VVSTYLGRTRSASTHFMNWLPGETVHVHNPRQPASSQRAHSRKVPAYQAPSCSTSTNATDSSTRRFGSSATRLTVGAS